MICRIRVIRVPLTSKMLVAPIFNLTQQPRQIGYSNRLQIGDSVNDYAAQLPIGVGRAQALELSRHRLPTHRTTEKAFVVPLLFSQDSAVVESDRDAARHLLGEPPAEIGRGPHADF